MILSHSLQPELSHIEKIHDDLDVFVTTDGIQGCVFEMPILDLESRDIESKMNALERFLAALLEGQTLRVIRRSTLGREGFHSHFRTQAIESLGWNEHRVFLSVESSPKDPLALKTWVPALFKRRSPTTHAALEFAQTIPVTMIRELGAYCLCGTELESEFRLPDVQVSKGPGYLNFGSTLLGIIRVYKPGVQALEISSLSTLLMDIPLPFEVTVSVRKVNRVMADFKLRSKLARQELNSDPTSQAKQEALQKTLSETSLQGAHLFEVEWIIALGRSSEATLRNDLDHVKSRLSALGDVMIETVGSARSYFSSRIGAPMHHHYLEEASIVPFVLPVFSSGEVLKRRSHPSKRTLVVHRVDGSLHRFDPFDSRFLAYNTIISGKTGSGKSVLAGLLSSALLQDPDIRMIKVDVGGSYKKECEALKGTQTDFRLDIPSGVNPFRTFTKTHALNESVDILAELLATLIREENEAQISKQMRGDIETSLKRFIEKFDSSAQQPPSIDAFLAAETDFPRRSLLTRWARGGVFENALKEPSHPGQIKTPQYRYFNFENIQAASNRDFSEGVMAAVIAQVNLEMLSLGDRSHGQSGERLVLFCDETKFFIDRFASFFLLTAANFRKFGHGLILMLQNIRNAEITHADGSLDSGLILNSPTRIFLPADTETEYLKSQFQFSDSHLQAIVTHPYRGREYREAVLQDDLGTRIIRVFLTDEEYWRTTSSKDDQTKFNQLRAAVPGLTLQEAIRCLIVRSGS